MLSVPRTRLSVRDVWSARRPSRTPSLLRLRSKSSQITNLGGAEVETGEGIDQPTDFDRPLRVRCRSGSVARFIRDGVVWIVSGAWNRVGDQGYAPSSPSSSSPSLPLHGEEHVKGPRKKKEKDLTVKAKQWHGALCDTKFPIFFTISSSFSPTFLPFLDRAKRKRIRPCTACLLSDIKSSPTPTRI